MPGARVHRPPTGLDTRAFAVQLIPILMGLVFAGIGVAADRIAVVWPPEEASGRPIGLRTILLAVVGGAAAWAIATRATVPWWAVAVHLTVLALLLILTATDLEQRRLPHLVLDPVILLAAAFVPFNPSLRPTDALLGAAVAVVSLGLLGLLIRGGVALGDIYLIAPLGLILGWPAIFRAIFVAALLSAVASLALLATRRVGLKSYIPFGPFLVAGAVVTLLTDPRLLGAQGPAATMAGLAVAIIGMARDA
jgi:leader peptidase (prepilin peptidase) / N-methyltransferase